MDNKTVPNLQGQIAHIDHDRTNHSPSNLAYLCIPHHDNYDSTTSQSKGLTENEIVHAKDALLAFLKGDSPSSQEMVSLTLTMNKNLAALADDQRQHLLETMLPSLVNASKVDHFDGGDRRSQITVSLSSEDADRICKAFAARTLSDELVDVRIARPRHRKIGFSDQFKPDRNGVSKQQAIESVISHDQAMLFLGKQVITSGYASCGVFTKRYSDTKDTVIVITSIDEDHDVTIYAALRAARESVGSLDDSNPLQCLESFLRVFGMPITVPGLPRQFLLLGETITLPQNVATREEVFTYISRHVESPDNHDIGMIGSVSYTFPPKAGVHLFFCFSRERYLASIRR